MTFRRTRCPHCKGKLNPGQRIHPECIEGYAEAEEAKAKRKAEKQARMQAKVERAEIRRRKEAAKTLRELLAEAQKEFNIWIRWRDRDLPCVSCGETNPPMTSGGQWDAGHFLSRGAHPEKRFMEDNCHKQCKSCNAGSAKNGAKGLTVAKAFEAELLVRLGSQRLDMVKGPTPLVKLLHDDVRAIRDEYRARNKTIERLSE